MEVEFILFLMFIVSIAIAALFGIFLMLLTVMTPAWAFFKARIKHRPLVLTFRRDGKAELCTTTEYAPGLVETKHGAYLIDEDSPYTEKKSNVTLLLASAEHGVTKSPAWLQLKEAMKQTGFDSIQDAYAAHNGYHTCEDCGFTGVMALTEDKEGNRYYVCPNEIKEDDEHGKSEGVHVEEPDKKGSPTSPDNKDSEHA